VALSLDLTGRHVLVTGGGQGIGRGIALGFAAAGAQVLVNDLDPARARTVVDEIQAQGGAGHASAFDVTDFGAVEAAVHAAARAVAPVDVLVNNAGNAGAACFGGRDPFAETTPDDWDPFVQVNLYGAMHCCRAVLPGMIAGGFGRLLTIVSDAGRVGDVGGAAYSAAKAGAAGLTRALARENGRYGITANNISLGTMRTPATEPLWADPDNDIAKGILRSYVVRRPGAPEDVAGLAVYLASDHASWITGQTYPLNGGYSFAL
jgi:NAD(P)-dependent dehydrogenase (short-subunit alcohol dehydrogenase family)